MTITLERKTKQQEGTKLVVVSAVRRATDLRVSEDFIKELSDYVQVAIDKAASRAQQNGRQTLQKQDL